VRQSAPPPITHWSPSPPPESLPSSQASSSSAHFTSLSPSTPSDSGSLGVSRNSTGGRSPKRSVEETDSPSADVESSLRAAKRRGRPPGGSASEANSEAAWESEPDPGPSSHPSSQSSRESSPSPSTPPPVIDIAPPPQPRLTRRQRKRLGLPKQKRNILETSVPLSSTRPVSSGKAEWIENGTGRLDVRGFRELKI
jgi:hypothetical protein